MGIDLTSSFTMKQSSISGSSAPSVNGVLPLSLLFAVGLSVGLPLSSSGLFVLVLCSTTVPSMVGPPVRLKYLYLGLALELGAEWVVVVGVTCGWTHE